VDETPGFLPLEIEVIEKLLAGPNPILNALRKQYGKARVKKREFTGVGFWLDIELPPDVAPAPLVQRLHLSDVGAELEGVNHGVGFVLHVRDGLLDQLEGFTYDEPWPDRVGAFSVAYIRDGKLSAIRSELRPLDIKAASEPK